MQLSIRLAKNTRPLASSSSPPKDLHELIVEIIAVSEFELVVLTVPIFHPAPAIMSTVSSYKFLGRLNEEVPCTIPVKVDFF